MLEGGKSAAQGSLGPALWVGLDGIFKEAVEGSEQLGNELAQLEVRDQIRRFGDYEVVAVCQYLAQRFHAGFRRKLAKRVQGGELFLEAALAGHEEIAPNRNQIGRA